MRLGFPPMSTADILVVHANSSHQSAFKFGRPKNARGFSIFCRKGPDLFRTFLEPFCDLFQTFSCLPAAAGPTIFRPFFDQIPFSDHFPTIFRPFRDLFSTSCHTTSEQTAPCSKKLTGTEGTSELCVEGVLGGP